MIKIDKKILFLLAIIFVILVGFRLAGLRTILADKEIRNELLWQAENIAMNIDPFLVKQLTFTKKDLTLPAYNLIRNQMIAYGNIIEQRGIYSMALRDGNLVFGPENYPENDPMGSGDPGLVFEEPSAKDFLVFQTGKAIVMGPVKDEYGTFISAVAPVFEPYSKEVLMVVGIDVLADDWHQALIAAKIPVLVITGIIILFIILGFLLFKYREKHSSSLPHLDTLYVGIFSFLLIIIITFFVWEHEQLERKRIFYRNSNNYAEAFYDAFNLIKNNMKAVARFHESSEYVDKLEFEIFSIPFTQSEAINAIFWADFVPQNAVSNYLNKIKRLENSDFLIWEFSFDNEKINTTSPEYLIPIRNFIPDVNYTRWLGFDMNSNERLKEIIDTTISAKSIQSTVNSLVVSDNLSDFWFIILPSLKSDNNHQIIAGFVMLILQISSFLQETISGLVRDEPILSIHLVDLENSGTAKIISSFPSSQHNSIPNIVNNENLKTEPFIKSFPFFAFGKAMAIVIRPMDSFYKQHPILLTWVTGISGFCVVILFSLFVYFMRNRQIILEQSVLERTTEIRESHEKIQKSLDEKTILIKEIHHRVKNNLQIISSMINLQRNAIACEPDRMIMMDIRNRIRAIALVHEKVYQSKNMNEIDTKDYILAITKQIIQSFSNSANRILLDTKIDHVVLTLDEAVPCALIINELITNAYKYAFPNKDKGTITIDFSRQQDSFFLIIEDDGIGLEEEIDLQNPKSIGLKIVTGLVQQLHGKIEVDGKNGLKYSIEFTSNKNG
jgi:two-component sensor histidine kinase/CHASE1-domain containing sensor protein